MKVVEDVGNCQSCIFCESASSRRAESSGQKREDCDSRLHNAMCIEMPADLVTHLRCCIVAIRGERQADSGSGSEPRMDRVRGPGQGGGVP